MYKIIDELMIKAERSRSSLTKCKALVKHHSLALYTAMQQMEREENNAQECEEAARILRHRMEEQRLKQDACVNYAGAATVEPCENAKQEVKKTTAMHDYSYTERCNPVAEEPQEARFDGY